LHLYDAATDWAAVVAARAEWAPGGRRGGMPPKKAVDDAGRQLRAAKKSLTRKDLYPMIPRDFLREVEAIVGSGEIARRFAAGRILWHLALRGEGALVSPHRLAETRAAVAQGGDRPRASVPRAPRSRHAAGRRALLRRADTPGPGLARVVGGRVRSGFRALR